MLPLKLGDGVLHALEFVGGNPRRALNVFAADRLLRRQQLHHCLHHETMKPEETSSPKGMLAQPVKMIDELSLLRFLDSSQMEQPVSSHILN